MMKPWPRSPNMTAKRKGNVTIVGRPGLTSVYFAVPYALMIVWKPSVNLLVLTYVGGVFDVLSSLIIDGTKRPARSVTSRSVEPIRGKEFDGHHASAINVFLAWS